MVRFHSLALTLIVFAPAARAEDPAGKLVAEVMSLIERGRGKEAAASFTTNAAVTGVPAENPTQRWTESAVEFLKDSSHWRPTGVESRTVGDDRTATVSVEFRHAHLRVRSTWELIRLGDSWKIDAMRFVTRRVPKPDPDLEKLIGTWTYEENVKGFNKKATLVVEKDGFQFDTEITGFFFFQRPPETESKRSGKTIRLNSSADPKTIDFEWESERGMKTLECIYKLEGDLLILSYHFDGRRPKGDDEEIPAEVIPLKRK